MEAASKQRHAHGPPRVAAPLATPGLETRRTVTLSLSPPLAARRSRRQHFCGRRVAATVRNKHPGARH